MKRILLFFICILASLAAQLGGMDKTKLSEEAQWGEIRVSKAYGTSLVTAFSHLVDNYSLIVFDHLVRKDIRTGQFYCIEAFTYIMNQEPPSEHVEINPNSRIVEFLKLKIAEYEKQQGNNN